MRCRQATVACVVDGGKRREKELLRTKVEGRKGGL